MRMTAFKCVGIGYALSNKELRSKEISILLPEQSGMVDGELLPVEEELSYDVKDIDGVVRSGSINVTTGITATWLPMTSWVTEAPSIRRGERVLVYTMENTDKFFWSEMGLDGHLRRRDTIIIAISNTIDEETDEITAENSYWIEFSTLTKKIAIVTTKSDEEPYAYNIVLDTEVGEFSVTDDIGNYIQLLSPENKIHIENAEETSVRIEKNTIELNTSEGANTLMEGPDLTHTNAEGTVHSLIGDTLTLSSPAGGKIVINDDVLIENSGGSKVDLSGGDITIKNGGGAEVALAGAECTVDAGGGVLVVGNGMVTSN